MIFMRATVPSSLQGGSLLDAHKWVKSKLARKNPGGTADYTLADSIGNPITLSDLVRNNPATIEVEIISGRGGVRNNPSLPLPTDFTPSADFVRGGNFSNQLLPKDLDPALVERMVAQEGIFGAVNTLTILLIPLEIYYLLDIQFGFYYRLETVSQMEPKNGLLSSQYYHNQLIQL